MIKEYVTVDGKILYANVGSRRRPDSLCPRTASRCGDSGMNWCADCPKLLERLAAISVPDHGSTE